MTSILIFPNRNRIPRILIVPPTSPSSSNERDVEMHSRYSYLLHICPSSLYRYISNYFTERLMTLIITVTRSLRFPHQVVPNPRDAEHYTPPAPGAARHALAAPIPYRPFDTHPSSFHEPTTRTLSVPTLRRPPVTGYWRSTPRAPQASLCSTRSRSWCSSSR
jgi:hypothetical protein